MLLKLVGLVSLSCLGKGAVKVVFRKLEPVLVPSVVLEQPLLSHTERSVAVDVINSYIAVFIFKLGLTTDTPRKQLIIHLAMQTMQFPAWFFKTKLDNMSGHAAFIIAWAKKGLGMA